MYVKLYYVIGMIDRTKQLIMINLNIGACLLLLAFLGGCDHKIAAETPSAGMQPKPEFVEKTVIGYDKTEQHKFLNNYQVYTEGWDTLAQARFGRMSLRCHMIL